MSEDPYKFSLDNFKRWMRHQDDPTPQMECKQLVGLNVEPKVGAKRISEQMTVEEGESSVLASDFKKNGGTIVEIDGKNFFIEVESGSFHILRNYVRRA